MKYFALILLVSFGFEQLLASGADIDVLGNKAKETMEKCVKTHGITEEQVRSVMTFEPISDQKVKCFLACMGKEMDFMKNDNTFDKRKITTTLQPLMEHFNKEQLADVAKKINEIIEICVPLQKGSGDECAAARKAYECILENGQKMELLPKKQ